MTFALDSIPTPSEISGAINYLLANFNPGLAADPVTGQVTGPTGNVLSYLYKYLAVKYSDSADGSLNFSNVPTNRAYFGLRNTDDSTESTNPADYIWSQVSGGFGTTKFLWYQTGGGRQVDFFVGTAAPNSYFIEAPLTAIDLDVVTGNNGMMYAMPSIYAWTSTSTPPTRPTTTSTYTWATGVISSVPSGWYSSIPAMPTGASYLWQIIVPLIESINVTTSTLDWTNTSYPITAISANGATGPRTTTGYLYYQLASLSAPSTHSASGYNYVTGQFSTLTANWSTNFSAPAATDTTKFWACYYSVSEATFGGTQTVTISSPFNWTNFNGLVTFTNLSTSSGTTFIDGGNIITNTINANKIVVGTLTGFTIQTAASGARIVMNGSTNKLQAYTSGGSSVVEIGGTTGSVYATAQSGVAAVYGDGSSLNSGGYFIASGSTPGLQGINSSAEGIKGTATTSGSNNHGIRGANSSTGSSGLIGPSNGYDFYADGSGTNYGPFTGTHDALTAIGATFTVGDIVADQAIIERNGISSVIALVESSTSANQPSVIGVVCAEPSSLANQQPVAYIQSITEVDGVTVVTMKPSFASACSTYNFMPINAVGEGQINVCGEGGDINTGDLISASSITGKGMKQADDLVHQYTVAKARESVTFASPTEVKQIACIYLCG